MDENKEFGSEVVNKLKSTIRQRLSARHVPTLILPIAEIPYTVNGKKVIITKRIMLLCLQTLREDPLTTCNKLNCISRLKLQSKRS